MARPTESEKIYAEKLKAIAKEKGYNITELGRLLEQNEISTVESLRRHIKTEWMPKRVWTAISKLLNVSPLNFLVDGYTEEPQTYDQFKEEWGPRVQDARKWKKWADEQKKIYHGLNRLALTDPEDNNNTMKFHWDDVAIVDPEFRKALIAFLCDYAVQNGMFKHTGISWELRDEKGNIIQESEEE